MGLFDTFLDPYSVVNFQQFCGVEPNPCRPGVHDPHAHQNGNGLHLNGMSSFNGDSHQELETKNGFVTKRKTSSSSDAHGSTNIGDQSQTALDENGDFTINNKFLYYLFHFGANLGNEVFYIVFYPYFIWNFDAWVGRRICMFWSFFMYVGQATKDVVKWPRPASPPVIRLEQRYALEYGMPSTHAMVGAGLPFSIYLFTVNRYEYPWYIGFGISMSWCLLVSLSRIYLGMHTFLDVLAGLLYVFCLMPVYFSVVEAIDYFALTHPAGPFLAVLVPLMVCIFYPSIEKWSTARGDTTLVVSVSSGILVGYWLMHQYGYVQPHQLPTSPYVFDPLTWSAVLLSLARLVVGGILLVLSRALLKAVILTALCKFHGENRKDPKIKQILKIELPYKFITYSTIAVICVFFVPLIFQYLGIQRDSYFTEGHTYYSQ